MNLIYFSVIRVADTFLVPLCGRRFTSPGEVQCSTTHLGPGIVDMLPPCDMMITDFRTLVTSHFVRICGRSVWVVIE